MGYLSGRLSITRFTRRFHALAHQLSIALDLLAAAFAAGEVFVIDSLPLPFCRRALRQAIGKQNRRLTAVWRPLKL